MTSNFIRDIIEKRGSTRLAKRATTKGRYLLPKLVKEGERVIYDRAEIVSETMSFYKKLYEDPRKGCHEEYMEKSKMEIKKLVNKERVPVFLISRKKYQGTKLAECIGTSEF